jgi:hypothetical protein
MGKQGHLRVYESKEFDKINNFSTLNKQIRGQKRKTAPFFLKKRKSIQNEQVSGVNFGHYFRLISLT